MGLMDWLKVIGGGVAAPFTGGASLPIALDGLGGVLGGAAKAGQQNNTSQDQLKILLENAKLNRDKFALDAPGTRLKTSTQASLTGNYKPSTIDFGQGEGGGFTPGFGLAGTVPKFSSSFEKGMSNLNPETKSLSDQVAHDMLVSQQRGGETGGGNNLPVPFANAKADGYGTDKAMPTINQSSTGDNILGGLGLGSSILSALLKSKGAGVGSKLPLSSPFALDGEDM